jgi:hypothetical protein
MLVILFFRIHYPHIHYRRIPFRARNMLARELSAIRRFD